MSSIDLSQPSEAPAQAERQELAPSRDIARLLEIMAALRTPGSGCPWDLEQTFATIAPYTIEEAYEVADDAVNIEQVSEVYSTSGQYDLLMKCYLDEKTDIGHFVTSHIQTLRGVKDTFTLITFKAFS